jgi:hypothetical protein
MSAINDVIHLSCAQNSSSRGRCRCCTACSIAAHGGEQSENDEQANTDDFSSPGRDGNCCRCPGSACLRYFGGVAASASRPRAPPLRRPLVWSRWLPSRKLAYRRELRSTYGLNFDPRNFDQTEPHYYFGQVQAYPRYWVSVESDAVSGRSEKGR